MQNERLTFVYRMELVAMDNLKLKSRIWDQVFDILKLSELPTAEIVLLMYICGCPLGRYIGRLQR